MILLFMSSIVLIIFFISNAQSEKNQNKERIGKNKPQDLKFRMVLQNTIYLNSMQPNFCFVLYFHGTKIIAI